MNNQTLNPEKIEPEMPKQELDEPFDSKGPSDNISSKELAIAEKDKDRKKGISVLFG